MGRAECRVALLNTGLFGEGEEAAELIEEVIDRFNADKNIYNPDGSIDLSKAQESFQGFVEEFRVVNRKIARQQLKDSAAVQNLLNRHDRMMNELEAQGKQVSPERFFDALFFGWNGKETVTNGKISMESTSALHMSNYMKTLEDSLKPIVEKYPHAQRLIGAQGNIFTDSYRGIRELFDKNMQAARRDFNLDVYRALEGVPVQDPVAKEVADALGSMYTTMAKDVNDAGGNIKIRENYAPHSHNAEAIAARGRLEWKANIEKKLDWEQTYPEAFYEHKALMEETGADIPFHETNDAQEFLNNIYHNITKGTYNEMGYSKPTFFRGKRATGDLEKTRRLEFIDGNAYAEYANLFGQVDAVSEMLAKIRQTSTARAAMEIFGTIPEENLNRVRKRIVQRTRDRIDLTDTQKKKYEDSISGDLKAGTKKLGQKFHSIMGYSDLAINANASKFFSAYRALQRNKLGAMNISALFGDPLTQTIQAKRVKGTPNNIFEIFQTLASRFDWKDREMNELLALESDEFFGAMFNRFDSPDSLAENKRLLNRFNASVLRWTGTSMLTDSARQASQRVHMRALANHTKKTFDELHPDVKHDLRQSGITEKEWNVVRQKITTAGSGRKYLVPQNIREVAERHFEELLPEEFQKKNAPLRKKDQKPFKRWQEKRKRVLQQTRDDIEAKMKQYYIIGDRYAVLQMDARSKYWTTLGQQRGTFGGEAWRSLMQFKQQPVNASNLIFREGRAGSTAGGLNDLVAYSGFLGSLMFLGYAAMTAKDVLNGRTPRPIDRTSTYIEAAAQSGGFGFIWDMLFNDNRAYGNPLSIAGPVGGDIGEVIVTAGDLRDYFEGYKTDEQLQKTVGKRIFKVIKGWFPRLWFARTALDYYLFNPIEDWIDPSARRKRERRLKKRTGQQYLDNPFESVF